MDENLKFDHQMKVTEQYCPVILSCDTVILFKVILCFEPLDKSSSVTIKSRNWEITEQYFPAALFNILYKLSL